MSRAKVGSLLAVGLVACFLLSSVNRASTHKSASPRPSPSVSTRVETHTVTKTNTVTVNKVPDSCLTAMRTIATLSKPDANISKYAGVSQDVLDDAVAATAGKDLQALVALSGKMHHTFNSMSEAIVQKYTAKQEFDTEYAKCLEDLK
jgi:hypothetical protein